MTSRILFLCTGNSARSILAEAIANQRHGGRLRASSAGSRPKDAPHPLALQTLAIEGLQTEGHASESWEVYADGPFDLVITLCDSARGDPCPVFPGDPPHVHWPLPDPPAADDPAAMFAAVFAALDAAVAELAQGDGDLIDRARSAARIVAEHLRAAGMIRGSRPTGPQEITQRHAESADRTHDRARTC